jgi:ureidoacrylate peracid hydrolase
MAKVTYDKPLTALLVIDPYNDFISEGGKLWDRLKAVAEANSCVPHMLQVLNAARKPQLRIFYALHRRYRPGDYETWKYIAPVQKAAWSRKTFEYGTWAGRSAVSSNLNRVTSWPSSIGVPVVLPIRISICS